MAPEHAEARQASGCYTLLDATGTILEQGAGAAVIDDDRLHVGPMVVAHLDADALRAVDHRIEIDRWPSGRLLVTGLGRRFDTFAAALAQARNRARVAGLLAHGLTSPEVFEGAVLDEPNPGRAGIHVYDTHVAIVPETGLPWQVPFGALTRVEQIEEPPAVVLRDASTVTHLGWLARRRDALFAMLSERVHAQRRLLSELTRQDGFADGLGVPRSAVPEFDRVIARFTAPARVESAGAVLAAADAEPRLGFVKLLDPDDETLEAPAALPAHWASFVLAPVRGRTVLEILSGPNAATYVFAGAIDEVNRDLQLLHFRRASLALGHEDARLTPDNPLRLALRALEPLRRLRDRTTARVIHNDGWASAFGAAIS
jgi:hypothetical protein